MVLDKSTQTQDIFIGKIAASLGCDEDREEWHTYKQHWEEEQQHCGEGDTVQCDKRFEHQALRRSSHCPGQEGETHLSDIKHSRWREEEAESGRDSGNNVPVIHIENLLSVNYFILVTTKSHHNEQNWVEHRITLRL